MTAPAATTATMLSDRGVVAVTGIDAAKLLQGLVTNDIAALDRQAAIFAGLLSPQGKILFEFFVVRTDGGFLLDTLRAQAADLAKRLTMYKLRADVTIRDVSDKYVVWAVWAEPPPSAPAGAITFADPRLAAMGKRWIVASLPAGTGEGTGPATRSAYDAHRVRLGVPEAGRDYALGEAFPHEALYDQLDGVSFRKGCYVGQEIVSRMEHRGTARKRMIQVSAADALPATGTEVMAGDVPIGTLGTVDGSQGLALVRLDRAAEFKAKGVALTAGGVEIAISKPAWARFALEPAAS